LSHIAIGLGGIALLLLIAFALSANRRAIKLRIVGAAFALQAGMAILVLKTSFGAAIIGGMAQGVVNLLGYAGDGINFLFGNLAKPELGGYSFAIAALPVIVFFASR
jgi:concentrative nucleoside transporter, CNT family